MYPGEEMGWSIADYHKWLETQPDFDPNYINCWENKWKSMHFTIGYDTVIEINPQEDKDVLPNEDILDNIKE